MKSKICTAKKTVAEKEDSLQKQGELCRLHIGQQANSKNSLITQRFHNNQKVQMTNENEIKIFIEVPYQSEWLPA